MDHKELDAWKMAMNLVEEIYTITTAFPDDEKYGLVSQMRRAAISVPSNIAEGSARTSTKDMLHFMNYALSSLAELETQILISLRLGYYDEEEVLTKISDCRKVLSGLIRYLRRK